MRPLAFDTETALIRPALLAPPMVCQTWQRPGQEPKIDHWSDSLPRLRSWLTDPETLIVGHFVAYDAAVVCAQFPEIVPSVFKAYREGRITCTKKRQQLLDIAGGVFRGRPGEKGKWIVHEYHLSDLAKRHLGIAMQKDGWRYSYSEFRDIPISKWPERAKDLQSRSFTRRQEIATTREAIAAGAPKVVIEHFDDAHADEIKNLDAIIADAPEGVIRYPLEDAACTLGVYQAQEKHADYLKDQFRQSYADFVLYLSSAWGLRTWGPGVEALKAELEEAHRELEEELQQLGLVRANGTRDMRRVKDQMIEACRILGLTLRRTDGHFKKDEEGHTCAEDGAGDTCDEHISLDSDACEAVVNAAAIEGVDVPFESYAEFTAITKMLSNDVKMLQSGTVYPVHTRYDIAETGRTTSAKPAIQNLNTGRITNKKSRAQKLRKGIRQAFIPRAGWVYMQADFPQLELYTLAQCCYSWLGFSKLGDMLNAGQDPHTSVAARILGVPYDEALARVKAKDPDAYNARQVGKVFDFGKPGGLGNKKLILYGRKTYGVTLTLEQCERYTNLWHEEFPEMRQYFARVNALFGEGCERATVETLSTERRRGGATYCASCNNGFQGLGSDCAKAAMCLVAEEQYCAPASPLYGSRSVAFVHDEIIGEVPDTPAAHDAAMRLAEVMVQGANKLLPNVPIPLSKMEPLLMRTWSKDAKQVFVDGRLVPWAP